MINEHFSILQEGKESWNNWINKSPKELGHIELRVDLLKRQKKVYMPSTIADLSELDLTNFKAFIGYNFYKVNFSNCNLKGINFVNCSFRRANFSNADLRNAKFENCNCMMTNFIHTNLNQSTLIKSNFEGANFSDANLYRTNFSNSKLTGSSLMWSRLIETNFTNADISNTRVYGASIWNIEINNTIQSNIIITKRDEFQISVDNLEVAQFLYLIISNKKIKNIIETLTSKIVLILGRFTQERKNVLNKLKEELTKQNYVPIIFDFQGPVNKNSNETILLIAQLARFVIADFSDAKIVIEEFHSITYNTSTIVIPILRTGETEPHTIRNARDNHRSISETFFYSNIEDLISNQLANIIETGNKLLIELNERKY